MLKHIARTFGIVFALSGTVLLAPGCFADNAPDVDDSEEIGDFTDGMTFSGCSDTQKQAFNTAAADALKKTKRALKDVGGDPKFGYYFGSSANVPEVTKMLKRIKNTIKGGAFIINCIPKGQSPCMNPGVVARGGMDNEQGASLDLCPPFFAYETGDVEAAATVVHEMSHILGTRDAPPGGGDSCPDVKGAYCYEGFVCGNLDDRW